MSEVTLRAETVDRQTIMIPVSGAVENLYALLRRVELQAKEMGIDTSFGDYARYELVIEDTAIGVILEVSAPDDAVTPPIAVLTP